VKLAGGAEVYMYVFAPNATIDLTGNGDVFGSLIGKVLTMTGGSKLHYDKALGQPGSGLQAGTSVYLRTAWKSCRSTVASPSCS